MRFLKNISTTILLLAMSVLPLFAEPLEKITFVKVSPPEKKAVIKTSDGKLLMVGVGDVVGDGNKITEISRNRVTLERKNQNGYETIIVTLHGKKQTLKRISKMAETKQPLPGSSAQAAKMK